MNAHERTMAALEGKQPDTVPVMCTNQELHLVYQILGGKRRPGGQQDSDLAGNVSSGGGSPIVSFMQLVERLAADPSPRLEPLIDRATPVINRLDLVNRIAVGCFMFDRTAAAVEMGFDAAWIQFGPIFKLKNSREAVDIYGRLYSVESDGHGNLVVPMYREGLIKTPEDWEEWPKDGLESFTKRMYKSYKKLNEKYGDRIFLFGSFIWGIHENTWQIMGFKDFVMALKRNRDFVKSIIKYYEDLWCSGIQAMADAGLPAVILTDDLAYRSGPMLSPETMRELYHSTWCRLTETAHSRGLKIVFHTCGNVMQLIDIIIECGFDGIHALEPTAGMEIAEVKEKYGDRLCLLGNIDITRILVDAPREEVFDDIRDHIRAAGPGGGYILAPTNSHKDITARNYGWMLEAAREYGSYPLG